jgi:hypothetical protein
MLQHVPLLSSPVDTGREQEEKGHDMYRFDENIAQKYGESQARYSTMGSGRHFLRDEWIPVWLSYFILYLVVLFFGLALLTLQAVWNIILGFFS